MVGGLFDDQRQLVEVDEVVHLGQVAAQVVGVALDHAAGDDQAFEPAALLVFGRFEDRLDRLLPRRLDEGAGVDDDHVGLGRVANELPARPREVAEHDLRVEQVLRTAETDDADAPASRRRRIVHG